MDAAIRFKDEERLIFQNAEGMFRQSLGKKDGFRADQRTINVWDVSKLQINGCSADLRVLKFQEIPDSKQHAQRELWLVTTLPRLQKFYERPCISVGILRKRRSTS